MEGVVSVAATSRQMTARSDRGQRCVDKMRLRKTRRMHLTRIDHRGRNAAGRTRRPAG
jgi:hypothetical protein